MEIPIILKVLSSLALILILGRFFKKLLIPILGGTLFLGFCTGNSFSKLLEIAFLRFISCDNILLLVTVFMVIALSLQMSETGIMKDLLLEVKNRIPTHVAMAVLPAIIGFLPMPGGAFFSAPLVDECDTEKQVDPLLKVRINYWFRHIWEYWWPLYPGVLLAIDITKFDTFTFMLFQFPLCLLSIFFGYIFLLRKIKHLEHSHSRKVYIHNNKRLFKLFLPIIIVIIVSIIVKLFQPFFESYGYRINKYMPMICGIIVSMLALNSQRPLNGRKWSKILFSPKILNLLILVTIIRIYGSFIECRMPDGLLLTEHIKEELYFFGVSTVVLIVMLPFIAGMTLGIAIGFVGASFPIVINLLGNQPDVNVLIATTILAYVSGYAGMLLSPVHICLIVTNEYFKTSLFSSIKYLVFPAFCMLFSGFGLYFLILYLR